MNNLHNDHLFCYGIKKPEILSLANSYRKLISQYREYAISMPANLIDFYICYKDGLVLFQAQIHKDIREMCKRLPLFNYFAIQFII